jgi:hypothetical protein
MDGHEVDVPHDRGDQTSRKGRLTALIVASSVASTVLSLFLAFNSALGQTDYLTNGGFEEGTSGWTVSSNATFVTVTTPVSSGDWAAALSDQGSAYEINIHQDVPIFAGASYTLTGWVYKNESGFRRVCLRVQWLPPSPGDSEKCLTGEADYYRPLTVGLLVGPSDATAARISAVAEIREPNPPSPVYFDDISLTSSLTPRLYLPLQLKSYER